MKDAEKRISEILDSLDGIERAQPDAKVFDRFSVTLKSGKVIRLIPDKKQMVGIAASLLLLAGINFAVCYRYDKKQDNTAFGKSPFANEYFDYLHSIEF